jgi:hypothetical protein
MTADVAVVNVIGDVAGNAKTLKALVEKMPRGRTCLLGDLNDRGPNSKEVFEFAMNTPNVDSIMANHEHMFYTYCRPNRDSLHYRYGGAFLWNGGEATMESFKNIVPDSVLDWIASLPQYREIQIGEDLFFLSHAALPKGKNPEDVLFGKCPLDDCIFWNRQEPGRNKKYKLQIFGHNSHFGHKEFSDSDGVFGVCIDTSRKKVLTGISLPSMTIYQQDYID